MAHVQGAKGTTAGATTLVITLGVNPTVGNLVCVAICWDLSTPTGLTIADSNSNAYTVLATKASNTTSCMLAYLLSAPSNASKTITANWLTASSGGDGFADEFSGGPFTFDKESAAGTGSGTAINTPSITPTNAGSLLFACTSVGGFCSAPTAGGTAGVWTGAGGNFGGEGHAAEYDLSATGATAANFTQSPSAVWSSLSMAFFTSNTTIPQKPAIFGPSMRI